MKATRPEIDVSAPWRVAPVEEPLLVPHSDEGVFLIRSGDLSRCRIISGTQRCGLTCPVAVDQNNHRVCFPVFQHADVFRPIHREILHRARNLDDAVRNEMRGLLRQIDAAVDIRRPVASCRQLGQLAAKTIHNVSSFYRSPIYRPTALAEYDLRHNRFRYSRYAPHPYEFNWLLTYLDESRVLSYWLGSTTHKLAIVDFNDGSIETFPVRGGCFPLRYSPHERLVAIVGDDLSIVAIDLRGNFVSKTDPLDYPPQQVDFSADGRDMIISGPNLRRWRIGERHAETYRIGPVAALAWRHQDDSIWIVRDEVELAKFALASGEVTTIARLPPRFGPCYNMVRGIVQDPSGRWMLVYLAGERATGGNDYEQPTSGLVTLLVDVEKQTIWPVRGFLEHANLYSGEFAVDYDFSGPRAHDGPLL